ncbi:MAG: MBL fold metallo-hydrolase [Firmicutes bacterium]|nr:MBL fold metallo-hydrolase [Bacillota bacterium]
MSYHSVQLPDNIGCYLWRGAGNNCHSYVLRDVLPGDRPHVLVDPGHVVNHLGERCLDLLLDAMARDGLAPDSVGLVVLTHAHPDHCEAAGFFAQEAGAPVALSRAEEHHRTTAAQTVYRALGLAAPQFTPFFLLEEGDLRLGRTVVRVLVTPGHTPGSVCLYLPEPGVLISGDVIFYGSVGRVDLPGGSLAALRESIERLAALDVRYLLPGHGTEYGDVVEGREEVEANFHSVRWLFY